MKVSPRTIGPPLSNGDSQSPSNNTMVVEVADHVTKLQMGEPNVPTLDRERPKKSFVQYRYVLIILGFFGLASVYGMRVNLNVAMVAMVNQTAVVSEHHTGSCPVIVKPQTSNSTVQPPRKEGPFDWDPYTQGLILGSFYYGYILTPIPGGRLAEKYGAKWLFGCGTLITGLLSLLIPVASTYAGAAGLISVRVLQGIGEGVTYPAIEAQVAHWIPVNQRATAISLIHTGGFFGVAVGMYISGVLADSNILGGWPSIFYFFGIWTAGWFILWALFTSNRPDDHPWASQEEVDMILNDLGDQKPTHASFTPWKKIFTSPAVFGVVCAHFGTHWLQYILVTELPTYLGTVLNFEIKENGFYSALPYMGAIVAGALSGVMADFIRARNFLSGTNTRKLFNGLAHLVPSIMLISVVYLAGCDGKLSLTLFVIAGTVRGLSEAGYMSIPVDMAPDYAGTILGICVCVGNTTGFLVPWITGALIQKENSTTMWSYNFYLAGFVGLATGLMFQLFASADIQEWGLAPKGSHNDKLNQTHHDPTRSQDHKLAASAV